MVHIPHLIVGAGPVGLILGHYFKRFNIPFQIFEKQSFLSAHPSAHYLNMRTMEILDELNIQLPLENIQHFSNYVYLRRIGETPLNSTSQLIDYKQYSYTSYAHLPQSLFVQHVQQGIRDKIQLNTEIKKIEFKDKIIKVNDDITCDYLYGCDGLNGFVRDYLKIKLIGNRDLQRFLNIHFTSKQLINRLEQYNSMLSFIYNSDITAVIIKHRIEDGTFAIQIPLDLLTGKTDIQQIQHIKQDHVLIKNLINKTLLNQINDIEIKSVGFWRMGAVYAEQYYKNNCILVGDACHGMPPAGGFGMNTGIQDAQNLAYKIKEQKDLLHYQQERQQIAKDNIDTALKYYNKSLDIAKAFTFDINKLKTYQSFMKNTPDFLYQAGVKLGGSLIELDPIYKRIKVNDYIPLVFPKEEIGFKYMSGDIGENGGQLAPLAVREILKNRERKWYSINCDSNHQRIDIENVNKMIVRSDMHIYQQQ
ncbi:unnamed protein product [Paramecium pentaurelia]|uniref:FAD-binding domain-containing protein n=1 Tax=Paramecium pentaurelia TaxID=43138 RepID=A0A8S1WZ18_9CILI|nr:unnamed protein product [Paramecium pentaurelia]